MRYCLSYYDSFDVFGVFGLSEIDDQIIQSKRLVGHTPNSFTKPEFSFVEFYNKQLTPNKFLKKIKHECDESGDTGVSEVENILDYLIDLFTSHSIDASQIEETKEKIIAFKYPFL